MNNAISIKEIKARPIINSRAEPTLEVAILTSDGSVYRAAAPSGASKGEHEALELRDRDVHFKGLGVVKAISNVNEIIGPALKGKNVNKQGEIDQALIELDGHKNKSRLGANAILPVSLSVCRAAAASQNLFLWQYIAETYAPFCPESKPGLPKPCFNIINGGMHAGNWLAIQEFMVIPQRNSYWENLKAGVELYNELKGLLINRIGQEAINVGDEGGFAPSLMTAESALDMIMESIDSLSFSEKFKIGLDCAAGTFFENGHYLLAKEIKSREALIDYYQKLIEEYPITFLEDPLEEEDWIGWNQLRQNLKNIDIIGDDLLATNSDRIKIAEKNQSANGLVVKLNQAGTLTETLEAAALASSFDWKLMVSHRSGDTNDDFIADLAMGIGADYFKSGAPARGERVAKYNRLLEIEKEKDE